MWGFVYGKLQFFSPIGVPFDRHVAKTLAASFLQNLLPFKVSKTLPGMFSQTIWFIGRLSPSWTAKEN